MKIKDLLCHLAQPDGTWEWLPVKESAYYKCLVEGSPRSFERYHELLLKALGPDRVAVERSYVEHLQLVLDIHRNGVKEPFHIVDNVVLDGQHRLSALLFLYGEDLDLGDEWVK